MKIYKTKEEAIKNAMGTDKILKVKDGWEIIDFWDRRYNTAEGI